MLNTYISHVADLNEYFSKPELSNHYSFSPDRCIGTILTNPALPPYVRELMRGTLYLDATGFVVYVPERITELATLSWISHEHPHPSAECNAVIDLTDAIDALDFYFEQES